MAELVVEALLSVVFGKLFEKLTSDEFKNLFKGKKFIDEQLKQLSQKLEKVGGLLNDAEVRQLDEPNVKKWLDDLKDVTYRAQDLMAEIDYEAQRSKQKRESKSSKSFVKKVKSKLTISSTSEFDKTVKGEMAKILEDLDHLLVDNDVASGLKEAAHKNSTTTGSSSQRQVAPWRGERYVHGRDAEKEEIMEVLLSNDAWGGKIGVLPIVGMGGLGKTTLAQLIYDDARWKERGFEFMPWVTVSTEFDILKIMKSILTQLSLNSTCGDEEQLLQRELKEALRGKKFLIILDDAWDDNYHKWDVLKSTFEFGKLESRVIVTTRSHTVASKVKTGPIHDLQQVPDDHCWKIFIDHAFDGDSNNADPRLQDIGEGIVKKCKGLPLAVTSLGGLLRSVKDPKEWESILKSNVWECSNEIHPSLWLSYCYLPSCLKQCFAYCSVFPKDYELRKEELILLWMAEGFLQTDKMRETMEEVGEAYFINLVSRSLFQRSSKDKSKFVMHDLLHDLAMFVSGEFCLAVDDEKSLELITNKTRHLSNSIHIDNDSIRKGLSSAPQLRTLILQSSSNKLIEELLAARRCIIRVLSLQSVRYSTFPKLSLLPDSISELKHLKYLNLSNSDIQDLPCSVCTLCSLQTLLLSNCIRLRRLPDDMGRRLINLRHLDTTGSPLKKMSPQMGNLTKLQTLTNFVLGEVHDNASSIKELGKLQHLGGNLCISGLQNAANVKEVLEANLRCKEKLTELTFEWQGDITDTKRDMEVLDALRPHTYLKKLTICSYGGSDFPNWIGDSSFSNVVSIHVSDNEYCRSLPPFGQLPSLQELVIKGFHGLEKIGAEFYGNNRSATPFQSLQFLSFEDMTELKQWSFIGGEKDGWAFPSLKRLSLEYCPKLLIGSLHLAEENDVQLKINPIKLISYGQGATSDIKRDMPVLHTKRPYKNSKKLVINGVVGSSFPNWILELLFSNIVIVSIDLIESQDCGLLPPLGQLPFLRELVVKGFHGLETIGAEFYGNNPSVTPFQSLEFLSFQDMSKWKHWSFIGGEREGGAFPSLKQLRLNVCPNLLIGSLHVANVEAILESNLMSKEKFNEQTFQLPGATTDTKRDTQVLDGLRPHTNSKKPIIGLYTGFSYPNCIGESSFLNVVSIHLRDITYCASLPPLGQLPFLRELVIRGFHGVELIGDEFYGNNPSFTPFQSLESLSFEDMSKWKQWSFIGGERDGRAFPYLKKLQLNGCPTLTGSLPNPDSLETLQISGQYYDFFPSSRSNCSLDQQLCKKLEFPGSHRYVSVKEMIIYSCDGINSLPLDYFPSLEKLSLWNCWNLESIILCEEFHSLGYLEIRSCKNLTSMPQHMHRLAILKIWGCLKIESFPKGGLLSSLKELYIEECSNLVAQHRHWDLHQLTSLNKLEISGCKEVLDSFPEGLLPVSLTHLSLKFLPNIRKVNGGAFQLTSLHELELWDCKNLQDLPEQVLCTSLRSLKIMWCPTLERRYQAEKGEDWHKISYIPNLTIGIWSRWDGIVYVQGVKE